MTAPYQPTPDEARVIAWLYERELVALANAREADAHGMHGACATWSDRASALKSAGIALAAGHHRTPMPGGDEPGEGD